MGDDEVACCRCACATRKCLARGGSSRVRLPLGDDAAELLSPCTDRGEPLAGIMGDISMLRVVAPMRASPRSKTLRGSSCFLNGGEDGLWVWSSVAGKCSGG